MKFLVVLLACVVVVLALWYQQQPRKPVLRGLPTTGIVDTLPLISIRSLLSPSTSTPQELAITATALDHACRTIGFFYISDHGVNRTNVQEMFRYAKAFFALPVESKQRIRMELAGRAWRGFFPVGGELTSGRPDRKEGIYFGSELPLSDPAVVAETPMHGPNLWPEEVLGEEHPELLGMRECVLGYMAELTTVAEAVLGGLARGLDLPLDYFERRFTQDPTVLFRIFNYPVHQWRDEEDEWGVREHTDYGFLTILLQDQSGGLQVRSLNGEWVDAPPLEDTFVVNIGDMLELWTHGLYRATPHRVRNKARADRLSFPLFFDPNWQSSLSPIDEALLHQQKQKPRHDGAYQRWDGLDLEAFQTATYGEFLWSKVSKVFPDLAERNAGSLQSSI